MERSLEAFFALLRESGSGLLLLDYDGTLAPFHPDRLQAFPAPGIREAVGAIIAQGRTRVVFVSGRPCEELSKLAGLEVPLEIWGCHGREYQGPDGKIVRVGVTDEQQARLAREREQVTRILPPERVELKTGCLAFHWRGIDEQQRRELLDQFEERWQRIAREEAIKLLYFDGGIELAIPGRTKGDAVQELLRIYGEEYRAVAFLGDDLTDEDGFRALGSRGLSVLVRNEPRETVADVRITMPEGILGFLRQWHEVLAQAKDAG